MVANLVSYRVVKMVSSQRRTQFNVSHFFVNQQFIVCIFAYLHGIYAKMLPPKDFHIDKQLDWLRECIQSGLITQESVYLTTGVHQSQVSRILSGHTKRASKNVLKLCKYSDSLHNSHSTDAPIVPCIQKAINQVWDGSPEHAEAIAKVILSLNGMAVRQIPY